MNTGSYESHRASLAAKAKEQYKDWLNKLTAEQRRNLERLGVNGFEEDNYEVGGHSPMQPGDMAESSLARVEVDFASHADGEAGGIADVLDLPLEKAAALLEWHKEEVTRALRSYDAELLSIVVGGLLSSGNIKISAAGLAFASQMDIANGMGSQAEYARKLGVSRTIISKSVKWWKRSLNLRSTVWQKSDAACQTYSENGKANHWRAAKATATNIMQKLNNIRSATK